MPDQNLHVTSSRVPIGARRRGPTGQQAAILQIVKAGPMTAEEVAAKTGIHSAGARLSELLRDGFVRLANGKRQNSRGKSVLVYEFMPNPQQRRSLGVALSEQFADGKWHRLSHIADKIGHAEDRVRRTLDGMLKKQTYGCKAEKKKVGQHFEYRIFRLAKTVSSSELIEKLTPILKDLEAEGEKNMATMSPGTVAYLAGQLRRLLEEWTE
jgi:predicted ArsR family transcriptional regulator